jgi:TatD DNase family protein
MTEPSNPIVDTHCHLTLEAFDDDRQEVIDRALKNGIHKIVVPGMDLESSREAIALAETYPSIYAAVGIHPHHASQWGSSYREEFNSLAKSPKVVAIGEIGLDYYRNLSPKQQQLDVFRTQLEIAAELKLPVIIHNREATSDIIEYLYTWSKRHRFSAGQKMGVLHAFSAELTTAFQVIDAGFLVGIAGPITYKNAESLREISVKIPLAKILIETDAPYLTPHPHRGKRNEPAYVRLVAEHLSKILGREYSEIARVTSNNAASLFGWNDGTNQSTLH